MKIRTKLCFLWRLLELSSWYFAALKRLNPQFILLQFIQVRNIFSTPKRFCNVGFFLHWRGKQTLLNLISLIHPVSNWTATTASRVSFKPESEQLPLASQDHLNNWYISGLHLSCHFCFGFFFPQLYLLQCCDHPAGFATALPRAISPACGVAPPGLVPFQHKSHRPYIGSRKRIKIHKPTRNDFHSSFVEKSHTCFLSKH